MNHNPDHTELLHRATIALTQLQRLLQQATDILANLHTLYLLHTRQVDAHFPRSFPPLPPPPSCTIPIPSPTSSCDSAPTEPIKRAPQAPTASQESSPSTPTPQPQPKKKRQPPPPLNPNADWDAWDDEADTRLVELKTDTRLCPAWNYVARRVGFSIEQCKARWAEHQEDQHVLKASIRLQPSPPPSNKGSPAHSLASTSPAGTPPAPLSPCFTFPPNSPTEAAPATPPQRLHSAPDYSYTPSTPPPASSAAEACAADMQLAISEDSHPEFAADQLSFTHFSSARCRKTTSRSAFVTTLPTSQWLYSTPTSQDLLSHAPVSFQLTCESRFFFFLYLILLTLSIHRSHLSITLICMH